MFLQNRFIEIFIEAEISNTDTHRERDELNFLMWMGMVTKTWIIKMKTSAATLNFQVDPFDRLVCQKYCKVTVHRIREEFAK